MFSLQRIPDLVNICQATPLRVLALTPAGAPKVFCYLACAVSKCTFRLGPVSAKTMYNAKYHSYNGAGAIGME